MLCSFEVFQCLDHNAHLPSAGPDGMPELEAHHAQSDYRTRRQAVRQPVGSFHAVIRPVIFWRLFEGSHEELFQQSGSGSAVRAIKPCGLYFQKMCES